MPAPPPGSPGMFRCAQPGLIANLFKQVGLSDVKEVNLAGHIDYGSAETSWAIATEVAAPVVAGMAKADDQTKEKIAREVIADINVKFPGANFPYGSIIISGRK